MKGSDDVRRRSRRPATFAAAAIAVGLVLAVTVSAASVSAQTATPRESFKQLRLLKDTARTARFWTRVSKPGRSAGRKVGVHARKFRSVRLDTARLKSVLARAPHERTAAARTRPVVVSLPAPNGVFPALRAPALGDHGAGPGQAPSADPDLQRSGPHRSDRDDPRHCLPAAQASRPRCARRGPAPGTSTHTSSAGTRASTRATSPATGRGQRRRVRRARRGRRRALRRPGLLPRRRHRRGCRGSGFAADAAVGVTISDPEEKFRAAHRAREHTTGSATSPRLRRRPRRQPRDPHRRGERRQGLGLDELSGRPRRRPEPNPPTGAQLRNYRLALITDPGYSAYVGGPAR